MLVLSRKANERILIGDDVEIVVVEVRGKRVRLGIKAPGETRIIRAELKAADNDGNNDELGIQPFEKDVEENRQRDKNDLQHAEDDRTGVAGRS